MELYAEELYICDKSGIAEGDIFFLAVLACPDMYTSKQRHEAREVLSEKGYGSNEKEIVEALESHIAKCENCREIYFQNLLIDEDNLC